VSLVHRIPYAIVAIVAACVVVAFAFVQLASDALYAPAAPSALVAHVPLGFGLRVYHALDRIAPAAYVEDALAANALQHGDLADAERYALRMPASPRRDDLLAQVARARGQDLLASEYFFAAADVDAMQGEVMRIAHRDLPGAMDLEERFRTRLIALKTHPDAVAASYWYSGNFDTMLRRYRAGTALYERALALAPANMGYVLSAANDALLAGDTGAARALFTQGLRVNPASGDALAGLGLVELRAGHRDLAQGDLRRAHAIDPDAQMIPALERALR
jgi:tetratricopeptide (TPR) repeat protein